MPGKAAEEERVRELTRKSCAKRYKSLIERRETKII